MAELETRPNDFWAEQPHQIDIMGRHPSTLISMTNFALLLMHQGKLDEAEPLCRESVEGFTEVLGPDHAHAKYAMSMLEEISSVTM